MGPVRPPSTLAVATALALAALPAAAGPDALGCGSLAPFGVRCEAGPGPWPDGGDVVVSTLGFVGTLEVRVAWDGGTYLFRCVSHGLSYQYPAPLVPCEGAGLLPPAGAIATLTCTVGPRPEAPLVPPVGSWGCYVPT